MSANPPRTPRAAPLAAMLLGLCPAWSAADVLRYLGLPIELHRDALASCLVVHGGMSEREALPEQVVAAFLHPETFARAARPSRAKSDA